ncbi:protein of unknown function [Pseudomonas sp. NFACC02]|uniref:DUF4214 domain-containing protein n=1 Tax=Pseudomonas sp. NFACC02 TaxID=1566250 RepID=UPI0008CCC786|nr:DUF4214 domain-containing protein [Pseudomonas sp. NFACC02]SER59889.1 protein of unknown function [Pseudomonas sp. NFACC02]
MALQYDAPTTAAALTAELQSNPAISATTLAAISSLLNLDASGTEVSVASYNAITGEVTGQDGVTPDVVTISTDAPTFARAAATPQVDVNLTPVADASVFVISGDQGVNATLNTVAGSDKVIVGGNGNDTITVTGDANVTVEGGDGNDVITTAGGNDTVIGGAGVNFISTGAGNDTIITGAGIANTIDAGEGFDTVQIGGARADFQISQSGSTLVLNGDDQTTSVTHAEFLSFTDGATVAIADNAEDAAVLRLYEGLLGRDADQAGAEFFTTAHDNGATSAQLAEVFVNSAEYKDVVVDSYIDDLYNNLLGRTTGADQAGQDFWSNAVANGLSLSDLAVQLAASTEGQAATSSDTAFVKGLYEAALGRNADDTGLDFWVNALSNGNTREDIASGIINSSEASSHSNVEFVNSLYTNALGRDNDANDVGGKAFWLTALENGASHAQVAIDIVGSPDAQAHVTNVVVVPGSV